MTAEEFWKRFNHLCDSYRHSCEGCPIDRRKSKLAGCLAWMRRHPAEVIQILEQERMVGTEGKKEGREQGWQHLQKLTGHFGKATREGN